MISKSGTGKLQVRKQSDHAKSVTNELQVTKQSDLRVSKTVLQERKH